MPSGRSGCVRHLEEEALDVVLRRADIGWRGQDAPSAPLSLAKRTLAIVASVLLPVQPKKTGMRAVFIFAVSTMIFFSSGASIDVSPSSP